MQQHFNTLDLSHVQKINLLESFDIAANLSPVQIDKLAIYFQPCRVQSTIKILNEGEKNNYFCLICDGKVDIIKNDTAENTKTVNTLGPGKLIGEISFFDQGTCSASVVAKEDVTLLVMDKKAFHRLCEEATFIALQIVLRIVHSISQRLRQTTGKLVDFL